MLYETYLSNLKRARAAARPGSVFLNVTRTAECPLAPSWRLLTAFRTGKADWSIFSGHYLYQIENDPKAQLMIDEIIDLLRTGRDVYLVCYEKKFPCHRYILKNLIINRALKNNVNVFSNIVVKKISFIKFRRKMTLDSYF